MSRGNFTNNGRSRIHRITHGQTRNGGGTNTYKIWCSMKCRCTNPNDSRYASYGGRGIKVCERWEKFENFLADMGNKPQGMSLDRIDNDGNYEQINCRWSTPKEQSNNMRSNVFIEAFGQSHTVRQWARLKGLNSSTLAKRISRGWNLERALNTRVDNLMSIASDRLNSFSEGSL